MAKYKGSGLLDLSRFSKIAVPNLLEVGDYSLTAYYNDDGELVCYSAYRNSANGIEYIIKPDQLQAFKDHIAYYTAEANIVYFNGPPSQADIEIMAGDYMKGLADMWTEALSDPGYYAYVATVLVGAAVSADVAEGIEFTNVTDPSADYVNYEITNKSFNQYKSLISNKYGISWEATSNSQVEVLEYGNIKYNARPFATNSNYDLTIDYYKDGVHIGSFRFRY